MPPSPAVADLLVQIRQHPAFPILLREMEMPRLSRFRISQAQDVEKARARWIFESGRQAQHEAWVTFLTGEAPKGENDLREKE